MGCNFIMYLKEIIYIYKENKKKLKIKKCQFTIYQYI